MGSFVCVFLQQCIGWNSSVIDYMENYRALPAALNSLMCQTQDACSLNYPNGIFFSLWPLSEKGFHCSIPGGDGSSYLQQRCQHCPGSSQGKVQYWSCSTPPCVTHFPSSLPFSQARTAQSWFLSCLAFSRRGNCFGMQVTPRAEQGCTS